MAERHLYIEGYGNFAITEREAERLERGESITLNIWPKDGLPSAEERDLLAGGVGPVDSLYDGEIYQQPKIVLRETDGPRVHAAPAGTDPLKFGMNPAVDPKKLVEQMDKVIGHESKYNYPRIEDQQERAKEYAKRRYGSEEAYTEFYRKRPTLDERLTVNTDPAKSAHDPISHPAHYTEGRKYEPKDVIRDWGLNFNLGSAVKYLSRAGRKGAMINDLEKAKTFIQFEIEALAEEGEEEE